MCGVGGSEGAVGQGVAVGADVAVVDGVVAELVPVIEYINARGISVLLVEQNVSLALGVASKGYALQVGRVVLEGGIEQFKTSEVVKRAYLGH